MIPTGLGMGSRTSFGDKGGTSHTLNFVLHMAGQDSMKLEAGEVFQNPAYASVRGNKQNQILASLSVRPVADESDYSYNAMRYREAITGDDYASPAYINFDAYIPAGD